MKIKLNSLFKGASIAAMFLVAGHTNAATIELDATNFENAVALELAAGTYEVTPIDDPFSAWNAWSTSGSVSGCDASGENCSQGFLHQYAITIGRTTTWVNTSGSYSTDTEAFNEGGRYSTAEAAFNNASSFVFSIAQAQLVSFAITDRNASSFSDNSGGVTLSVNAVPLPAAAWLFLSAIGGMAGFKRLRRTNNASVTV